MLNHENGYPKRKGWCNWPRGAKIAVMFVAFVVLAPLVFLLAGSITMWLWNWLMPAIFKLPVITFWRAVGLFLLSHILFRGSHFRRMGSSSWKKARIRRQMREEGTPITPGAQSHEPDAQ